MIALSKSQIEMLRMLSVHGGHITRLRSAYARACIVRNSVSRDVYAATWPTTLSLFALGIISLVSKKEYRDNTVDRYELSKYGREVFSEKKFKFIRK